MRIKRVSELPHGGAVYIERCPGEEPVVWLDSQVYSQEQAENLARRLGAGPTTS